MLCQPAAHEKHRKRRWVLFAGGRGRRTSSQTNGKMQILTSSASASTMPIILVRENTPLNLLFYVSVLYFCLLPQRFLKLCFQRQLEPFSQYQVFGLKKKKQQAILNVNVKKKLHLLSQQNVLFQLVHKKHILSKRKSICLRITIANVWDTPKCPSIDDGRVLCVCVYVQYDALFTLPL